MTGRFAIVGSLFAVSLMWPSEGAVNGDGLHWAILWMAAAAFGCWQILQSADFSAARFQSSDSKEPAERNWRLLFSRVAPFVIVAGVWASTAYVFQIQADRRAALNVSFEWTAILAASVLFWQWPASAFRQQFGRLVVGVVLGVAMMGILQHHVVWQQRADWYLDRMAAIESWGQAGSGAAAAKQAEAELLAQQVPLTGSAADTFRRRLLDSTEAIGPFALANTLGGFLAVGLVLIFGFMLPKSDTAPEAAGEDSLSSNSQSQWKLLILPILWAIVIGYALVLTKSRTAWVATAVGVFWLWKGMRRKHVGVSLNDSTGVITTATSSTSVRSAVISSAAPHSQSDQLSKRSGEASRMSGKVVLVICVVVSGLFIAGVAGGAIDREVLLESPKSLRYRLMYWMGTIDLLADHSLLGTGPGNFRNTYLAYKLPDSSEQILDPHNLPLDVYCSAGLLGLIGLLMLVWTAFTSPFRSRLVGQLAELRTKPSQHRPLRKPLLMTAAVATGMFAIWEWFNGADLVSELGKLPDGGLLVMAIPVGIVLVALTVSQRFSIDRSVFQAGFATLLVHLMGAGAFQISAVGLILMCLHRGSCSSTMVSTHLMSATENGDSGKRTVHSAMSKSNRFANRVLLIAFSLCGIVVLAYGLIPVRAVERAVREASAAETSGRMVRAVSVLDTGMTADAWNVKLRQRKAEMLAYLVTAEAAAEDDSARTQDVDGLNSKLAIAACADWEQADSTSYRQLVVESQVQESLWKLRGQKVCLLLAIDLMNRAVDRYPTNAEFLSRLALLQRAAGLEDEATLTGVRALKQDEINRNWGHAELYLDDLVLDQLGQLLQ